LETELKFQVPTGRGAGLRRELATASARSTRLQAVYTETPDLSLAAAGLALRLRKEGRVWVQTLKGRGDGLLNRLEHEVRLPPQRGLPELDVSLHAGTAVGARLGAALANGQAPHAPQALQPLYRTDIQRLHRRVRFEGAVIEIAFDKGWLLAGPAQAERRLAVNEIEFELVSGPPAALPALALRWVAHHGLWWDSRTKSERGMRLALGIKQVPATPAPLRGRSAATQEWRHGLMQSLAWLLPNAAEIGSGLDAPEHSRELRLALRRLCSALQASGALVPHADQALALAAQAPLLAPPLQPVVTGGAFNAWLLQVLRLALSGAA
jgi:inorganic triphosphatase YgiF